MPLSKLDKKLLKEFFNAYEALHLVGYYDGNTNYDMIKSGMDSAAEIIKKIILYPPLIPFILYFLRVICFRNFHTLF